MMKTIIFEDGHEETTDDSFDKIEKRFGISHNSLIRYSSRKEFINGIYIKNIDGSKYACCRELKEKPPLARSFKYKDPIKGDICSYYALSTRKVRNKEMYKNIELKDCRIIEQEARKE